MNSIDQLTLELFTNKTQYKKYLSKNEPENYKIMQEWYEKKELYSDQILKKTEELLSSSNYDEYSLLFDSFYKYVEQLLKVIDSEKELEHLEPEHLSDIEYEDDEDILFPSQRMNVASVTPTLPSHSYWSQDRVVKQTNVSNGFVSHYPTNSIRRRFVKNTITTTESSTL